MGCENNLGANPKRTILHEGMKKVDVMKDYDEIVIRVPRGLVPDGCTLEWRPPNEGEEFLSDLIGAKTAKFNHACKRPVIVPPFDLEEWWEEWFLADEIYHNGAVWIAVCGTRLLGLFPGVVDLDFSKLDKSKVYRNPHRKVIDGVNPLRTGCVVG